MGRLDWAAGYQADRGEIVNPSTARKLVPAAMVVTSIVVGIEFFKHNPKQGEGFKVAWALGALYLILALGVDVAPEAAGPLALLVMMGVVFGSEFVLTDVLHVGTSGGSDTQEPAPPPGAEGGAIS